MTASPAKVQPGITTPVELTTCIEAMRRAIDLYRQHRLRTVEIEHIVPGRVLSAKFEATRTQAQTLPEQNLG